VGSRYLDDDNLISAFKTVRDTIADWLTPGLAPGQADNNKGLTWHCQQEIGIKRGQKPFIRVQIYEKSIEF
jgi:hypothetical protein